MPGRVNGPVTESCKDAGAVSADMRPCFHIRQTLVRELEIGSGYEIVSVDKNHRT